MSDKEILQKLFKIAQNQQKILTKLAQNSNTWSAEDAKSSDNDEPSNFWGKLAFVVDLVEDVESRGKSGGNVILEQIRRLADGDEEMWSRFGKTFHGWSVNAIKKLLKELQVQVQVTPSEPEIIEPHNDEHCEICENSKGSELRSHYQKHKIHGYK
jgi:arginyl-tRNA synthetase